MKKNEKTHMDQHAQKQTLSDVIGKKVQQIYVEFTDKSTGETKQAPRFVLRGYRFIKAGAIQPEPIYFDGNKTIDALRKEGMQLQTIPHALYLKARMMKNYCSELKMYDNAAEQKDQLIYDYMAGMHEKKELLDM
jgi:hypothetical protein